MSVGKIRDNMNLQDSSGDLSKIFAAISNQRWFFFPNNKQIIFDSKTALIWANLNLFPWWHKTYITGFRANCRIDHYFYDNSYEEVKDLISKQNSQQYGGFSDWRIPTPDELWNMIEDKSFPFKLGSEWCINNNGNLAGKDLDDKGAYANISNSTGVYVIPCSSALVTSNFSATPQEIFDIFKANELIPLFKDEKITELYKKIISEPLPKKKSVSNFDYQSLLASFDTEAINKSVRNYFEAVLSVSDELLGVLRDCEESQAETIAEFLKITLKLKAKYTENPKLTIEENSLLAERQKSLAQRLEIDTDETKRKILSVKAQAENFFTRLDEINGSDDSIREPAELQTEPREDFELLVENLARIILDTQRKVDFFATHKNLISKIVESQAAWSDNYKAFKTSLHEELSAACRNENINEEIFAEWYHDWQRKRFTIEQRFLPLIKFALDGHFTNAFYDILGNLQGYRDLVDNFYLHERKNIYQKFASQVSGDLQEKFETESELYKLAEKLQRDLQGIIFSRDKTEERIFLLKWSEPLLNLPIDEISNFIRDKNLGTISEEVLTQFAAIKRQNFAIYLADNKAYDEAIQKRGQEYNALISRMRKDLYKS